MNKRSEILMSASDVFMRYGVKSVSMDDLAREMGISKKTIYQVFKDKNELVEEIIRVKLQEDQTACQTKAIETSNAIEALMGVIMMVSERMSVIHPSVFYDLQKYHPNAWKLVSEHQSTFVYQMISSNIERGRSENIYRENFDVELVSKMYILVVDSIARRELTLENESDISRLLQQGIHLLIMGMSTDKGIKILNSQFPNT
jgi:AcrR family transcriptional regulator